MAQYDVTLRDYWRILRRRKGIVVFTACLVGLFSFVMASTIGKEPPLYVADATVQLNSNQSPQSMYLQAMSAYTATSEQTETQRAVITSYPVLRMVAKDLGFFTERDDYTQADTVRAVKSLKGKISTRQEGYTDIIIIEAKHHDPQSAYSIANATADAYEAYDFEQKNQHAR
ncbi:MAG: Wzz/FepE/Etk N-terminal domain-containing protein, partial [Candidatus Brocadiia bacterium]|nr:Wzz/FepE/Etk N-terminal domain-containing protein [Candidatus Brocadiia bacterium]